MNGGIRTILPVIAAGLFLFAAAFAGEARADIIGRDDRKPLPPKLEQALGNAIGLLVYRLRDENGRLVPGRYSYCTATCVGRHTILTAAHCVIRIRRHRKYTPDLGTMRFMLWPGDPKRRRVFDLAGFPDDAERRRFMRAGPGNVTAFNGERPLDWALLPLEAGRACPARLRMAPVPMRDQRLQKGAPLMLVGFHGDLVKRGIRELRYTLCHALADTYARRIMREQRRRTGQSVLVHDCDATGGASGSPMLVRNRGRIYIAAVLSGHSKFGRTYRNRKGQVIRRKIVRVVNVAAPAENIIPALKRMKQRRDGNRTLTRLRWQERLMLSTGLLTLHAREKGRWRALRGCTAVCVGPRHIAAPADCLRGPAAAGVEKVLFRLRPHLGRAEDMSPAVPLPSTARGAPWTILRLTRANPICRPLLRPLEKPPPATGQHQVFVAGIGLCRTHRTKVIPLRQVACRATLRPEMDAGAEVALRCKAALPETGGVMLMNDPQGRPRLLGLLAPFGSNVAPCSGKGLHRTQGTGVLMPAARLFFRKRP